MEPCRSDRWKGEVLDIIRGMCKLDAQIDNKGIQKLGSSAPESLRIFKIFIRSLYDKPYSITEFDDLDILADITDCYRALPAVLKTLTKAIIRSMDKQVYFYPSRSGKDVTARTAVKLRYKDLFRDCIISIAGNWGESEHEVRSLP